MAQFSSLRSRDRQLSDKILLAIFAFSLVSACSKQAPITEPVRPVRTIVAQSAATDLVLEYPGDVRPRVESRLGFRVNGKLAERRVDVGQSVKAGELLARLDSEDLRLAQANFKSQLDAADTDRKLAEAEYQRYADLFRQNFISQAELDRRKAARDAAQSRFESAHAGFENQSNQTGYAELRSDVAGVVTAVDAEVGQVVAAGQGIVRVARAGEPEFVIAVPEDKVEAIRSLRDASVSLWAVPGVAFDARVREVAASSDPATRTYQVKLSLLDKQKADRGVIRLGMTAVARFQATSKVPAGTRVPLSAVVSRDGKSSIWVVDEQVMTVAPVEVQLVGSSGDEVVVAGSIKPGQHIVTAGQHVLQPGQKVRYLDASQEAAGDSTKVQPAKVERAPS
jgi:RND family efflux transporter MFP subunit